MTKPREIFLRALGCGTGGLSTSVLNHDGHGAPCPYSVSASCITRNTYLGAAGGVAARSHSLGDS